MKRSIPMVFTCTVFQILIFSLLLPTNTGAQHCGLPVPFDSDYTYINTLYVSPNGSDPNGNGSAQQPFRTLTKASQEASPGTLILLEPGEHIPGQFISNLQGTAQAPIKIAGVPSNASAIFIGGTSAIQMSDPRYVILENFSIREASGNGLNIDDGGTYDTPAEHIIIRNLDVRNIGPSGNRDAIKLSGLDQFRVENCFITRPGDGGSAIDMVGCHDGILTRNTLFECENTGIQAKGGCARLLIYANRFENAGLRAVNMGGSTGLPFFRPLDAPYEAAHVTVWANLFIGSQTPIAFVGCENGLFAQNTVYLPNKWVARILQETTGGRFVPSRNNVFANNIVVVDGQVSTFVNIGPNTQPGSFIFSNNLWFHVTNSQFAGPNLPTEETNSIIQINPRFIDASGGNFSLETGSPAIGSAGTLTNITQSLPINIPNIGDYDGRCYTQLSLGAFSANHSTGSKEWIQHNHP